MRPNSETTMAVAQAAAVSLKSSPRYADVLRNVVIPVGVPAIVLTLAVVGSVLTGTTTGAATARVDQASSSASGLLETISLSLPLGFAFAAGMVSAVNPCGFSMLPAYLGLYLAGDDERAGPVSPARQLARGLLVGGAMTAGFIVLFAVVGMIFGMSGQFLVRFFPWIGLAVGVGLVLTGGWMLRGGTLYSALGERLAARIDERSQSGLRSYLLFGVSYGTASLSCTLPIFLIVVGGSVAVSNILPATSQFVLYGLGMGAVITVLTLGMVVFKAAFVARLRQALPYIQPISTVLLLAAGGYIVYYWLTQGGLLDSFG